MKKITFFIALFCASLSFGQTVIINEVDSDQTSTDTEEFIELLSQNPNQSLDGYIVVLYNGSSDESYNTVDLAGFSTDGDGYFIIGSDAVTGVDISLGADNTIQNGADAIVIYQDDAANFPNGTPVTGTNVIDAIVYGTSDDDDVELLAALGLSTQYDEDLNGEKDTESLQRIAGTSAFCTTLPTLRATNVCPDCTFVFTSTSNSCDDETTGQDSVTVSIEYQGAGNDTYTVTSSSGDVGGDDPTNVAAGTIVITNVSETTTFTVTVTSSDCNLDLEVTTPACVPAVEVATIAALRASAEDVVYILTGEALVTFTQDFRNQKFIEDGTAAILIDDNNGVITTSYAIGDGVTGLKGELSSFNGMMQFSPEEDPGAPSSNGNTITAQTVSISDLNANPGDYESEYVEIQQAVSIDISSETTWTVGTVFELTNGGGTFNFRTSFFDANYIDQLIPTDAVTIAGIITEREADGLFYITARDNDDASTILGVNDYNNSVFSIYPNPANEFININSVLEGNKAVIIYDLLGKQVINTVVVDNKLNVSALTNGLYIVQISQGANTSTRKLVIK